MNLSVVIYFLIWDNCLSLNLSSPTGGAAAALLFFFLHLNPVTHEKTFRQHVADFDFTGLFLIMAGVICILLGFTESQSGCEYLLTYLPSIPLHDIQQRREISRNPGSPHNRYRDPNSGRGVGRLHGTVTDHTSPVIPGTLVVIYRHEL